jgi:hypothetical protein
MPFLGGVWSLLRITLLVVKRGLENAVERLPGRLPWLVWFETGRWLGKEDYFNAAWGYSKL